MTASDGNPAFVDTNILIYTLSPADRRYEPAFHLVNELMECGALRTSTQVLQEFFTIATRKIPTPLTASEALAYMESWAILPVVLLDYPAIREAGLLCESRQLSFWDSLIVVAARRCGAKQIYTEDLNHGQVIEGVEIIDPFR